MFSSNITSIFFLIESDISIYKKFFWNYKISRLYKSISNPDYQILCEWFLRKLKKKNIVFYLVNINSHLKSTKQELSSRVN